MTQDETESDSGSHQAGTREDLHSSHIPALAPRSYRASRVLLQQALSGSKQICVYGFF